MGSHENAYFRSYLLKHLEPIPADYYTDSVLENTFLNRLLIKAIKINQFIFNNYTNVIFQSRDTEIRRELYKNFRENHQCAISKHSTRRRRSQRKRLEIEASQIELSVPKRDNVAYLTFCFVQFFLFAHHTLGIYNFLNPDNKELAITCSKSIRNCQTLVKVQHEPVRLTTTTTTTTTQQKWHNDQFNNVSADCFAHLESYILERYDKFYFWNLSVPIEPNSLFYNLLNDWILVEQNQTFQLLRDEVGIVNYIFSLMFSTFAFLSSFVAEFVPYDIVSFVFIFDPYYSAHYIKSRVHYYQELMRKSYKNYWSIYEIKGEQPTITVTEHRVPSSVSSSSFLRSCTTPFSSNRTSQSSILSFRPCDASLDNTTRNNLHAVSYVVSNNNNNNNNISTSTTHDDDENWCDFKSYIPSARSQTLRKVFMLVVPIFNSVATTIALVALMLTFLFVVGENYDTIDLNGELKAFLSDGSEPAGFQQTIATYCSVQHAGEANNFNETKEEISHLVRRQIIDHLGATLEELRGNKTSTTTDLISDDNQLKRLVLNSIDPTKKIPAVNWLMPFWGSVFLSLLIALFFCNFFAVLCDLCFWLFEIRMKLDICKILLTLANSNRSSPLKGGGELEICMIKRGPNQRQPKLSEMTSYARDDDTMDLLLPSAEEEDYCSRHNNEGEKFSKMEHCNLGTGHIMKYIISHSRAREKLCHLYADNIEARDKARGVEGERRYHSDSFLLSTYLDFRLFIEQIDMCRNSMNFLVGFAVCHALNFIASSQYTDYLRVKFGILFVGYSVANLVLLGSSFFQSQCMKLIGPIHSMLALSCKDSDKTIHHLSLLWSRTLVDLSGERTKFSFSVYSITITYALALEFNLAVTTLYILALDKGRFFRS